MKTAYQADTECKPDDGKEIIMSDDTILKQSKLAFGSWIKEFIFVSVSYVNNWVQLYKKINGVWLVFNVSFTE